MELGPSNKKSAIALMIWFLSIGGYMFLRGFIIDHFPAAQSGGENAPQTSWEKWVGQDIVITGARVGMIMCMVLLCIWLGRSFSKISFSPVKPRLFWLFVFGIILEIVIVLPNLPQGNELKYWLVGLATTPFVALNEELAFRWCGLKLFSRFAPLWLSAALSSLAFVFFHVRKFDSTVTLFQNDSGTFLLEKIALNQAVTFRLSVTEDGALKYDTEGFYSILRSKPIPVPSPAKISIREWSHPTKPDCFQMEFKMSATLGIAFGYDGEFSFT